LVSSGPLDDPVFQFEEISMKAALFAAATIAALAGAAPAHAFGNAKVGVLLCQVASGDGFVFGSTKTLTCSFTPASGAPLDYYTGAISRFGVDLGFTSNGLLQWNVLADSFDAYKDDVLAGYYGGVGAEITALLGVGTNVLVKRSTRDFVLQPISVQGQTGLNIALGVAEIELTPAAK
jgi:hypothetical protein